jgi:signal transduction histidine kinase
MNSTIRLYTRSWHFWIVVALLVVGVILHYPQQLPIIGGDLPKSLLGLERHSGERLIFLGAIVYGGLMFGVRAGVVIAVVSLAAMVPRFWLSKAPADAVIETGFTVVVGVLVTFWFAAFQSQKRELERAMSQLHASHGQLEAKVQASERGGGEKERKRAASEAGGETAQGLAALSREFEGLSQRIDKFQERLDQILAGMGGSK